MTAPAPAGPATASGHAAVPECVPPRATYRVQLHAGFGFDDVAAIAPYLAALGVSHVYCSPYLQAAKGSTHGYDVVDHSRLNAELGGEEAHSRMTAALAAAGLSSVLDIVPNHMAAAGRENAWWWDLLENGPSSRYAVAFDVDWSSADPDGPGMLLPILGDHYGRVLEAGELRIVRDGARFLVRYYDHLAPVAPRSLEAPLTRAALECGSDQLATIAAALGALPPPGSRDRETIRRRHRDKEVLLGFLERLLAEQPHVAAAVDRVVAAVNADSDALDALLARQNFRLAYWRLATSELAYRRFFDITSLVGLRTEVPHVFDETHELVLRLVADGAVSGLRVDHPDGLRDPEGYLRRLYERSGGTWVVVEKILEPGEELPPSWPVAGTTGYDFLNLVGGLFVDPAGEEPLTELHSRFTGTASTYHELVREKKHLVMNQSLGPDVRRVTELAAAVCRRYRRHRDHGSRDLEAALRELVACFPVYRTYVQPGRPPTDVDAAHVAVAIEEATGRRPDLDPTLFAFLADVLLLRVPGPEAEELLLRFQQLTGPVMAKGAEDTAFYCYRRLMSLNEVGGDPGRFGTTVEEYHRHNRRTADAWPSTLLTVSTHDTKRSGDVRARISLLSEIPDHWALAVRRWSSGNEVHKRDDVPDRGAEYLLYQTLFGAWPLTVERAVAYMEKATKEAKEHTSWIDPDPEYDAAVRSFVESVLADPEFTADLAAFVGPLVEPGRVTALAQTLLTLTAPGCPDVYQGTELWDLSLVDPDNRRPVDYDLRLGLLDKVAGAGPEDVLAWYDDGAPKLWLVHRALGLRRSAAAAFGPGSSYAALPVDGAKAHHAVAYVRGGRVAVVVPRLVLGLDGDWGDTTVELPPGRWTSVLDGGSVDGGAVSPADLLARFPVALLAAE